MGHITRRNDFRTIVGMPAFDTLPPEKEVASLITRLRQNNEALVRLYVALNDDVCNSFSAKAECC